MHNSFWFLLLIFLSVALFFWTLYKKRNIQVVFLLLTMIGLAYVIETVIFNFLASYVYKPHFIENNPYYDNELGAFVSNAFAVPVIATFIAVFHLTWKWVIFFSGLFVGIEWLFIWLKIYSHNWWRLEYTGLGFIVYFFIAKVFYKWISQSLKGFKHFLIAYLIIGSISASAHVLPIVFFENRSYHPGWFTNYGQDTITFAAVFYLCASIYYYLAAKINWKRKWMIYAVTGLLMFTVNQVFIKLKLLHSLVWWDQPYYVLLSIFLVLTSKIINKELSKN